MKPRTNYFMDCEFIDDGRIIDLISIGLFCEDGRSLYRISTEFQESRASAWVKENVIDHLPFPPEPGIVSWPEAFNSSLAYQHGWRSRQAIAEDIELFCSLGNHRPRFWGYYGASDWVAFYQLWGPLINLPHSFPKHFRELKQWCDDLGNPTLPEKPKGHHALEDARWHYKVYKFLRDRQHSNAVGDLGVILSS
ncbi:MAG: 3'-5' exoribonuclease [Cyanobacteria bacterium P01_H01_bin.121]